MTEGECGMDQKPSDYDLQARRVRLFRTAISIAFVCPFVLIPCGFVVGALSLNLGTALLFMGFALMVALVLIRAVIMPFVRCPNCQKPFFVNEGWASLVGIANPFQQRCIHCWKALGER